MPVPLAVGHYAWPLRVRDRQSGAQTGAPSKATRGKAIAVTAHRPTAVGARPKGGGAQLARHPLRHHRACVGAGRRPRLRQAAGVHTPLASVRLAVQACSIRRWSRQALPCAADPILHPSLAGHVQQLRRTRRAPSPRPVQRPLSHARGRHQPERPFGCRGRGCAPGTARARVAVTGMHSANRGGHVRRAQGGQDRARQRRARGLHRFQGLANS